jgi:hypothetical protein
MCQQDAIFLVRVLRHDWSKYSKHIETLQEETLKTRPTDHRWSSVTTFDYTTVPTSITVTSALAHLPDNYRKHEAVRLQFDESVTGAKASEGRLALMHAYIEGFRSPGVVTIVVPIPN